MKTPLPEMSVIDTHLPSNIKIRGFTEAQMLAYGRAEFERALLLAMNSTRSFGKTGKVIAVIIGHFGKTEE